MTAITQARPARRTRLSTTAIVYIVLVGVIALSAVLVSAAGESFFTSSTLTSVLTLMSILGFVAIGQTLVIISGSLDLSVPYVVSTASIVGAEPNEPWKLVPSHPEMMRPTPSGSLTPCRGS